MEKIKITDNSSAVIEKKCLLRSVRATLFGELLVIWVQEVVPSFPAIFSPRCLETARFYYVCSWRCPIGCVSQTLRFLKVEGHNPDHDDLRFCHFKYKHCSGAEIYLAPDVQQNFQLLYSKSWRRQLPMKQNVPFLLLTRLQYCITYCTLVCRLPKNRVCPSYGFKQEYLVF